MDKKKLMIVLIIAVLVSVVMFLSFTKKETEIKGFGSMSMVNIKSGKILLACEDAEWIASTISLFLDEKIAQEEELKKSKPNATDNETLDYLAKNLTSAQIVFQDEVKKLQLEVGKLLLADPKQVDAANAALGVQIVYIYKNILLGKSGQQSMSDVEKTIRDAFCATN